MTKARSSGSKCSLALAALIVAFGCVSVDAQAVAHARTRHVVPVAKPGSHVTPDSAWWYDDTPHVTAASHSRRAGHASTHGAYARVAASMCLQECMY